MAWEQIGTYESLPFWADDSLGVTDQEVQDNYLSAIQQQKAQLEEFGATASQAFLKDGAVLVTTSDPKDDPRFSPNCIIWPS